MILPTDYEEAIPLAISYVKAHWLLLLSGYFLVRITTKVIYNYFFHPLAGYPGPFFAAVSDWYCVYSFFTYKAEEVEYALHQKYGPVVRYKPNMLLISDPDDLKTVYGGPVDKDPIFYGSGGLGMGLNVFTAIPHKVHARLKKRIAFIFSMTSIRTMEHLIDSRVQEFQAKMANFIEKPRIDFALWAQFYTYDVLSELTFGKKFGFMENEVDLYNLVSGLLVGLPLVGLTNRIPFLNKLLMSRFIADKVMPRPTDKDGIGAIMGHRDKLLDERIKSGPVDNRHDLLHYILSSKNPDGSLITKEEVRDELLIIMLAGSDTTSNAVRACVYRALQTPGVYEKLMKEIDEAYVSNKVSRPVITFDEALSLPYYSAFIKEVLRLDPSAPGIFPRVAPPKGYTLKCGKFVPEGTVVSTNAWVNNRNKATYGSNAEEFSPERWMGNEEKSRVMENLSFTFGYGPRVCLGKNIALLELHKVVFQLFLHFRPELVDLDQHGPRMNLGNYFQCLMWVKINPRVPGSSI